MCEPREEYCVSHRHELSRRMISAIREYIDLCVQERLGQENHTPLKFDNKTGGVIPDGSYIRVDCNVKKDGNYAIQKHKGHYYIAEAD